MIQFEHAKFTEISQKWIVLYGDEAISTRSISSFLSEEKARSFNDSKKAEGVFSDLFVEKKTIETKRL